MNNNELKISEVKDGWAVYGEGWAVHAPTKEEAIKKFRERTKFREQLSKLPLWYLNPANPKCIIKQ